MSSIILPGTPSWYGMCKPQLGEMETFLKRFKQPEFWRVPKIHWQQLWLENRGDLNHVLGVRHFGKIKGPRYQRGMLHPAGFWHDPPAAGGDAPALTDITNTYTTTAPTNAGQQVRYHTNGYIDWDEAVNFASIVYAQMTTDTDDANDHTYEWWDAAPSTGEGANYDIRYTGTTGTWTKIFYDTGGAANRVVNTWYLISTVYADSGDGVADGCLRQHKPGGNAKSPNPGTVTGTIDVEIRATGSGSALASHTVDLTSTAT